MSGIKRYAWNGDSARSGELVLHADHEAEIARLRAELNAATKAGLDAIAEMCEKERQVDALRSEVEKIKEMVRVMQGNPEFDFNAALAAMGEGK